MDVAAAAKALLSMAKATISIQRFGPKGDSLTCRFNPQEYTISASARWQREGIKGGKKSPKPQYVRADARTLSMELFFDDWESFSGDVSGDVEKLISWTRPLDENRYKHPPILAFRWGTKSLFEGYLESVDATYELFRRDGTPVRAHVTVKFREVDREPKRGNPTSGGLPSRRSCVVSEGDTLQSIAWREYGNVGKWRVLADANGIDDPLTVRPGRTLFVPSPAEAARA